MAKKNRGGMFDWIPYLFGDKEQEAELPDIQELNNESLNEGDVKAPVKSKKKKRKGIDDENPVSFRTATEPLTFQQIIYYIFRDVMYAAGPMFTYIIVTLLCIILGYPLSGMMNYGFEVYLEERSNLMIAIGVIITLRILYKKSRKKGSTFFEDASLYHKGVDLKKVAMCMVFGAGTALFLSALLTLIPKVWIFATYNTKVSRIYQRYDILLTIIESAVLTPLVEEIIFRGYMLNRLLKRWPDFAALIVTTLIFSVMHGSSIWIIYAFVMGWIIGRLSMFEDNIIYGIFLHMGFNLPSVIQWFTFFLNPQLQKTTTVAGVFQTFLLGSLGAAAAVLMFLLYRKNQELNRL